MWPPERGGSVPLSPLRRCRVSKSVFGEELLISRVTGKVPSTTHVDGYGVYQDLAFFPQFFAIFFDNGGVD